MVWFGFLFCLITAVVHWKKTATLILSLVGSLFSFKRFLWLVNVKDDDEDESEDNEAEGQGQEDDDNDEGETKGEE